MDICLGSANASRLFDYFSCATDNLLNDYFQSEEFMKEHIPKEEETYLEDGYYIISFGKTTKRSGTFTLTGGYEYLANGRLFLLSNTTGRPPDIWYLENIRIDDKDNHISRVDLLPNCSHPDIIAGEKAFAAIERLSNNSTYKNNIFTLRKLNVDGECTQTYDLSYSYPDCTVKTIKRQTDLLPSCSGSYDGDDDDYLDDFDDDFDGDDHDEEYSDDFDFDNEDDQNTIDYLDAFGNNNDYHDALFDSTRAVSPKSMMPADVRSMFSNNINTTRKRKTKYGSNHHHKNRTTGKKNSNYSNNSDYSSDDRRSNATRSDNQTRKNHHYRYTTGDHRRNEDRAATNPPPNNNNNDHVILWKAYRGDGGKKNSNEVYLAATNPINGSSDHENYRVWLSRLPPHQSALQFTTLPERSKLTWTFQRC